MISPASLFEDEREPQAILPGFRKYLGFQPRKKWWAWRDRRGTNLETQPKFRPAGFFGAVIPPPKDKKGLQLDLGDLSVLLRTDGRYVVVRYADRSDRAGRVDALFLAGRGPVGKRQAVVEMVSIDKQSKSLR